MVADGGVGSTASGADTRTRLLQAAAEMIDSVGEAGLRIAEIAAAAGVREPSVYHFFGSRAGLVEAAQVLRYGDAQSQGVRRFAKALDDCSSREEFVQVVEAVLRWTFSTDRAAARAVRISVLGSAMKRPALLEQLVQHQRESSTILAEALRDARDRGWARPDLDPMAAATWVIGQVTGRLLAELDPEYLDGDEWNDLAVRGTLAVLVGPPTPHPSVPHPSV